MTKLIKLSRRIFIVGTACLIVRGADGGWLPLAKVGGGGGSTTTLDPTNLGTGQVLSNGNLTDTGSGNSIAQSLAKHSSGKFYCEVTCGTVVNTGFGVCNSAVSLNNFLGVDNFGAAVYSGGGYTSTGVSGTTTCNAPVAGHVFGVAIDVDNRAIWMKDWTAAGNWNANGTANPATNTNGCILGGGMATGNLCAAVTCANTGDNVTFNFGASAYTGTPPAGFGNW